MDKKYDLNFSGPFFKKAKRLLKKDITLKKKLDKVIDILVLDPFYSSLKTHKVASRLYGKAYSSWVSEDIRLIWDFNAEVTTILDILDLGSHSGSGKVYK